VSCFILSNHSFCSTVGYLLFGVVVALGKLGLEYQGYVVSFAAAHGWYTSQCARS
jgi:hypothetical protein